MAQRATDAVAWSAGIALGVVLTRVSLSTAQVTWALDKDLFLIVAGTLLPGACAGSLALRYVRSPVSRGWFSGYWLLWATAAVGLAWTEVWLDAGTQTGALGKLLGGLVAVLGTPVLGVAGGVFGVVTWASGGRTSAAHWCGIGLSMLLTAAWAGFLAVVLPLRF